MKNGKEQLPVIPSKDIVIGEATAPLRMILFGDYESEACAKANEVIKVVLEQFSGFVNISFRHFPLTRLHQKAHKAAEAAIGAAQEGHFWEYHNHLFQNRKALGVISLKTYAREVGVKDKKYLDRLINGEWGWFVQDDIREGLQMGVTTIPALFINGQRYTEDITLKGLQGEIKERLKVLPQVITLKEKKRA